MNKKNKYIITIVGTTAIGKTALGIKVANYFNCEIISADSRQFFKEMNIGTAVPTKEEQRQVKHHFIQNLSIFENYSVGDFEKDALHKIKELHINNDFIVLLGGSGLYIDAVLKGLDYFPKVDTLIRENLKQDLAKNGIETLQNRLKKLDIVSYKTIEINNPQRLIRALEICIGSGKPYSLFLNKEKGIERNFKSIKIGLTAERQLIYKRINKRVDFMVEKGLVVEAKKLHQFKHLNALKTVGYKELFTHFEDKITLDFAIEEIKKNTRRFAKRQITWFKRDPKIKWFDYTENHKNIINYLAPLL
ncbi:MAG: tRNA (adenosine(37)-N6)-dimethylallyltransferase MiaA [Flavobacteriaceae bacterium]|nr:tRNA (adenosine(37)-N6)-dimethylallyltransferase MiaA [Flavobacteriaceae bacterium]